MTRSKGLQMYSKAQGTDEQSLLIEQHAPLVKRIAYHMLARLPASVQVDDLAIRFSVERDDVGS